MKNILKSIVIALAAVPMFVGCTENEKSAVQDPYATNFVYLKSPDETNFRARFSTSGTWKQKPDSILATSPIYCTKPANGDIKVQVEIDEALVASYNEEHGTSYQLLSEVKLLTNELTVKSGSYVSVDSLTFVHTDYASIIEGGTAQYLVPVKLTGVKGNGKLTESRPSVFYFIFDAAMLFAEVTTSYTETKVSDRSAWVIKEDEFGPNGYDITDELTDGSLYTDAYIYSGTVLCIDLGRVYENIADIGLESYYNEVGYMTSSMTVEVSEDNSQYTNLGQYSTNRLAPAVLNLFEPVDARYLKITVGRANNYSNYIAEINIATKN